MSNSVISKYYLINLLGVKYMLNQIIKPVDELNFSVKKDANQQEVRNYIETHFPTRSGCELKELSRAFHIINDNIETACGRGLCYCIIPLNEIV